MIDKSDINQWLENNFLERRFGCATDKDIADAFHQCFTDLSDQWVSVSDRLPKEDEAYFVTDGRYINIAEWSVDLECFYTDKLPKAFGDITHFREFMEPPK